MVLQMDNTAESRGIMCWVCPDCLEQRRRLRLQLKRAKILSRRGRALSGSTTPPPPLLGLPPLGAIICPDCTDNLHCDRCQRQLTSSTTVTNPGHLDVGEMAPSHISDAVTLGVPSSPHIGGSMPRDLAPQHASPASLMNGIVPIETDDIKTQNLFVDAFLHNNRLEHMVQVMGYHPEYLDCFLKTQQYMMRGDGPLPYDYRHYIAIMAAGRYQCAYIVHLHESEFLSQGGDERWLKGLEHVPRKLQELYELNKVMAHRPWLINKSDIEKLTKGEANWSLSELMHAVVLLAHFHSLCSFIYGCGINVEIDHSEGHTSEPPTPGGNHDASLVVMDPQSSSDANLVVVDPPLNVDAEENSILGSSPHCNSVPHTPPAVGSSEGEGGIELLMERMRRLNEEPQEDMTQEELVRRFEKVETQSAELPAAQRIPATRTDLLKYVRDPEFTYQDFIKKGLATEIPTFRAQDFSWSEQGFSLANRLYADIGTMLDEKFETTYNLTYFTMGNNTEVDTSSFRRAIWNYIQCMFAIRHDDYDYSEVNQLLGGNLKSYAKTVTCYPERVTKKDYDSFMQEFRHSEKVHVNLMLFEARVQAELLYALRAITRYMT